MWGVWGEYGDGPFLLSSYGCIWNHRVQFDLSIFSCNITTWAFSQVVLVALIIEEYKTSFKRGSENCFWEKG